jgi:TrmH family RNA methyltransferase
VEGIKENEIARKFGFEIIEFFICETIFKGELPTEKINFVSRKIYGKIAYRENSEGIIGVYKTRKNELKNFNPQKKSKIIVIESVEKPGNLGAILRSCEAFGIDAIIITDPKTDFYNPNVIRSSVGCLFAMNYFQATNEELLDFLQNNGFNIFTTFMNEDAEDIFLDIFPEKSAIIFGTENSGLSDFWKGKGKNILIPMSGMIDSLNLSNSVAICCYEILKQDIKK